MAEINDRFKRILEMNNRSQLSDNTQLLLKKGASKGAVAVHSDDGYAINKTEFYDIWKPLGIPYGVAVLTGLIDTTVYLTTTDIKQLSDDGCEILSHGVSHSDMTLLTEEQLHYEFSESKRALEEITGKEVNYFVYPYYKGNAFTDRIGLQYYDALRRTGTDTKIWFAQKDVVPYVHDSLQIDSVDYGKSAAVAASIRHRVSALINSNAKVILQYHKTDENMATTDRARFSELKAFAEFLVDSGASFVPTTRFAGLNSLVPRLPFKTIGLAALGTAVGITPTLKTTGGYGEDYAVELVSAAAAWNSRLATKCVFEPLSKVKISFRAEILNATDGYGIGIVQSAFDFKDGTSMTSPFGTQGVGNLAFYDAINSVRPKAVRTITDDAVSFYYLTPPDKNVNYIYLGLGMEMVSPTYPITISDYRIEVVEKFDKVSGTATLAGTTGVKVGTGWPSQINYNVTVTPTAALAGNIYVVKSNWFFTIHSTDAADVGTVAWTIS